MTEPQKDSAQDEFLADPFLTADVNIDTRAMSTETVSKMNAKFGRTEKKQDDGFGLRPEVIRSQAEEYAALLRDPAVRREMAERGGAEEVERYEKQEREKVVAAFRQANPDYLKTPRNGDAVIQALAKRYLQRDWLSNEDAACELWAEGKWTVQELTAQYKACLAAGELDVPRGTAKVLSESEELQVLAKIRVGDTSGAIIRFVELSFSGRLPAFQSAEKFLAEQPELASKAALFVWANSQAALSLEEFQQFQSERLSGTRLLTYALIDRAFAEWKKGNKRSYLFPNGAPETATRENLDDLSNEEINERLTRAVRDYRRGRSL